MRKTILSFWLVFWLCQAQAEGGFIGVICTLPKELNDIVAYADGYKKISIADRDFYVGKIKGQQRLVIVRSPMGKVNNAITAQILVDQFKVASIMSLGFAGALQQGIKPGDIIMATNAVQHDTGTVKPYGFVWQSIGKSNVNANSTVKNWANKKHYHYGRLVSGDQFIASAEKRDWLAEKFNALAVDTNSAATKQVCEQNNVACVFIREISDRADVVARQGFESAAQTSKPKAVQALISFLKFIIG